MMCVGEAMAVMYVGECLCQMIVCVCVCVCVSVEYVFSVGESV